ncbi:MAG: hypothetical protein WAL56_11115 [Candidatus Sulfotelmatobacter sp.]
MRSGDDSPIHSEPRRGRARRWVEWVWLALIVTVSGLHICPGAFGQSSPAENQSNVVRGTVVDAVINQPIGHALVYSTDNRYATMTDGEGHFEFALGSGQASGGLSDILWLMARKPGFLLEEGGPTEASPRAEVTLTLTPEGLIKGRISLSTGDAARGVNVQILSRQVQDGSPRWNAMTSTRTNSSGEFRFAELQPGTYKVFTHEYMDNDPEVVVPGGQQYGYPPVYYPSATEVATASTIQLTAGQIVQADMTLVRQAYYPVKIPVINPEQTGGMNVTVSPQGQHGPGYSLGYNRGKNEIDGQLPNGKYLVEGAVYAPNFSASGAVNLVVAGAPAEGPTMVLARNNSITVNVKEEFTSNEAGGVAYWSDGRHNYPMRGARRDLQIRAEAMDDFEGQRSAFVRQPTDPNDEALVLENLVPGRYWLRLTASRGYVASATMGGVDLLREPLVVVPGAGASIDVTMRDDNAEIEGTLLGVATSSVDTGRASSLGHVYCIPLPDSAGQFLELGVGSDGKFDYRMVAPGVYRVIAFRTQKSDIPYRDAEAMKAYESKGQVVHFASGQKVSLQLQVISDSD